MDLRATFKRTSINFTKEFCEFKEDTNTSPNSKSKCLSDVQEITNIQLNEIMKKIKDLKN